MALLRVVKGSCPGQLLELHEPRMMLGRHPHCQIVLDNAAVSRQHAQILESHGTYYLEDLRSRNGTQLNGTPVQGRTELREFDEIRVCDFVFQFHLNAPSLDGLRDRPTAATAFTVEQSNLQAALAKTTELDSDDQSSIISRLDAGSATSLRLDVKPDVKLRAVLEIGATLGQVLRLDEVLPRILQSLFNIFPQADHGFVLLKDPETNELSLRASRGRHPDADDVPPVSMTIVRQAMESAQAILSADVVGDRRFEKSDSVAQMQLRSVMCVPLVGPTSGPTGIIQLSSRDVNRPFLTDDLDLLTSVAIQAALAVENARAHEALVRQRDLERDLEFATQVQLGFLPKDRPRLAGYEFADYYEAANRVGGDYFDYIPLPNGNLVVALGDVAGKGVPAALLMARLYSLARFHLLTTRTAAEALAGLNCELAQSGLGHRFISLVLLVLDPKTHTASVANAGHLPPMLRTTDGKVVNLGAKESGFPLGIVPVQQFQEVSQPLAVGDALLLYTDGINEAMDANNELYGRRRLSRFLTQCTSDAETLVDGLIAEIERFTGTCPQRDDICVVAVRRVE